MQLTTAPVATHIIIPTTTTITTTITGSAGIGHMRRF
jgi:hypothetical protein